VVRTLADRNSLCVSTINRLHILRAIWISYSFIHASVPLSFCSLSLYLPPSLPPSVLHIHRTKLLAGKGRPPKHSRFGDLAGGTDQAGVMASCAVETGSGSGVVAGGRSWPRWWEQSVWVRPLGSGGWWVVCYCILARMRSRCESIYILPINLMCSPCDVYVLIFDILVLFEM
jgi:hypothetical protein